MNPFFSNSFTTALVVVGVVLLFLCIAQFFINTLAGFYREAKDFTCRHTFVETAFVVLFIGVACVIFATKPPDGGTDKGDSPARFDESFPPPQRSGGLANEIVTVSNLQFSAILANTNSVSLAVAWPSNSLSIGNTLDLFAKVGALTNDWKWLCETNVADTDICIDLHVPISGLMIGTNEPTAVFFLLKDRGCCAYSMDDADCDGIPDAYEISNGTHPYIADSTIVSRLTVGEGFAYPTIQSAIEASTNYSIISIAPGLYKESSTILLPTHPIMLCCEDGFATIESANFGRGVFELNAGQTTHTLIRNVRVVLSAKDSFQTGFWVGGNTPWSGIGSAATFENVHVRALYPGVEHFGWLFMRDDAGPSILRHCTMNAAGSTWAYGVWAYNAASNIVEDCIFLNMPTNAGMTYAVAQIKRADASDPIGIPVQDAHESFSWAGYPLEANYSSVVDSDGDGLSDYDEIFNFDTDPNLYDSDGDGIADGCEALQDHTNPRDMNSHACHLEIIVTNTIEYSYTTNYVYLYNETTGATNAVYTFSGNGGSTNIVISVNGEGLLICAYRDINRNGFFDEDYDIILPTEAMGLASIVSRSFKFGDVDRDGVSDVTERSHGTDPYSELSVRISRNLQFVDEDPIASTTNYYSIGLSPDISLAGWTRLESNPQIGSVAMNATNGCLYALVLRDINANGEFDEGVDVLYTLQIVSDSVEQTVMIKDADSDGVLDSEEIADGTDPMSVLSYCYSMTANIKGVFSTTNQLLWCANFGTNEIISASAATNRELFIDFGHLTTSNREYVSLWFWDDVNSNSVRDATEAHSVIYLTPNGHSTFREVVLQPGRFDSDNDGLLDWWTIATGLEVMPESHRDYDDNDLDGLVNLHEYWAGTNPIVPDGSNTLLSVCARSIDARIEGVTTAAQMYRFVDYELNAQDEIFILNTNFWARNLDLSCVSALSSALDGTGKTGSMSATAITRRRVVSSKHWHASRYWFCDMQGMVTNYNIIAWFPIPESDMLLGRLDGILPDTIALPKIIDYDYDRYIGTAKYLPSLCYTHYKAATVMELEDLNVSEHNWSDRITYHQLGKFASTNVVNSQRVFVRNLVNRGNSGSPSFIVVGDELVFLFSRHMGQNVYESWGTGYGPNIAFRLDLIRAKIQEWEGVDANLYPLNIFDAQSYGQIIN